VRRPCRIPTAEQPGKLRGERKELGFFDGRPERREAEGLVELVEFFSLLKLQARKSARPSA
jgi:hypothetical protein